MHNLGLDWRAAGVCETYTPALAAAGRRVRLRIGEQRWLWESSRRHGRLDFSMFTSMFALYKMQRHRSTCAVCLIASALGLFGGMSRDDGSLRNPQKATRGREEEQKQSAQHGSYERGGH